MKSFNKSLTNSIKVILSLMQTFQILLMYYETMEESAIIFLLPELIKQGFCEVQFQFLLPKTQLRAITF